MTDMRDGFLNFHAEPRPAHERTLERILHEVRLGFGDVPQELREHMEPCVVGELCYRVCGTALPNEEFVSIANVLATALDELKGRCEFAHSRDMLDGTISWLKRTYL